MVSELMSVVSSNILPVFLIMVADRTIFTPKGDAGNPLLRSLFRSPADGNDEFKAMLVLRV